VITTVRAGECYFNHTKGIEAPRVFEPALILDSGVNVWPRASTREWHKALRSATTSTHHISVHLLTAIASAMKLMISDHRHQSISLGFCTYRSISAWGSACLVSPINVYVSGVNFPTSPIYPSLRGKVTSYSYLGATYWVKYPNRCEGHSVQQRKSLQGASEFLASANQLLIHRHYLKVTLSQSS
jgi:hypothetical protein